MLRIYRYQYVLRILVC